MLVSPLASSTTPAVIFRGHDPSCRWVRAYPVPGPDRRVVLAGDQQRHRRLDVVPDVDVPAHGPRHGAVGLLHRGDRGAGTARSRPEPGGQDRIGARRLVEVDHQALAEDRVEHLLGPARGARALHDVPDQDPVVGLRQGVVVVVHADRALDPPVRRVQGVGVVLAVVDQPRALGLGDQLRVGVDADVAAGGVVVVAGELPADGLGEPSRHREGDGAAGPEHPHQLVEGLEVGGDVLEDLGGDDPVELAVGEGQREGVALLDVGLGAVGHLARAPHLREHVAHPLELVDVLVEGDDVGAPAVHLERVPARSAAEVEHPLPRPETESVEVNGEHGPSCPGVGPVGTRGPRSPRRRPRPSRRRPLAS